MRASEGTGARRSIVAGMVAAATLMHAAASHAQWTPSEGKASVVLPPPSRAKGLDAATLACDLQRWTLSVALAEGFAPSDGAAAVLSVDREAFPHAASITADGAVIRIERGFNELLKSGGTLTIALGEGKEALSAAYSLRGSRAAIAAIEPLCTNRDVSGLERLVLSEMGPAAVPAAELRAADMKAFRQANGVAPRLAAEIFAFDGNRRLMFAELCGGGDYYGGSGCNLAGYAQEGAETQWRIVYEAEGASLHVDRKATTDGWPSLLAIPRAGGEAVDWIWSDGRYRARTGDIAAD